MFERVDANDKIRDDQIKAINEKNEKDGFFGRLMAWNTP